MLKTYVTGLPSLHYSWDVTEAMKTVIPHDDSEFATIMLHAMLKMWKQQYHLGPKTPSTVQYHQDTLEKIKNAFPVDG
jgi:hypothetical protein